MKKAAVPQASRWSLCDYESGNPAWWLVVCRRLTESGKRERPLFLKLHFQESKPCLRLTMQEGTALRPCVWRPSNNPDEFGSWWLISIIRSPTCCDENVQIMKFFKRTPKFFLSLATQGHLNCSTGTIPVAERFRIEIPEQMRGWKNLLLCKENHGKPAGVCFASIHAGGDDPRGLTPGDVLPKFHRKLNFISKTSGKLHNILLGRTAIIRGLACVI